MTINCRGNLIDLTSTKVMGILNITPDSFFDGAKFSTNDLILTQVQKMLTDGADFIDIGAASSKPNASFVLETDEISRILPVVDLILKNFPNTIISIDTFRSEVARLCLANGASIINDISAGSLDLKMMQVVANANAPYIMMHMRGTPKTMQNLTDYDDIVKEIIFYFSEKIAQATSFGIKDLIVDPGFGFAKTTNQNFDVLKYLELFQALDLPLLAGISRKSMIYKTLDTTTENALNGTSVLNTIALTKGAKILRVHDVKEAVECIKLVSKI